MYDICDFDVEELMVSRYLGREIYIEGNHARITMLRVNHDIGIAESTGFAWKYWLVQLSTKTVIRQMNPSEDFDKVLLGAPRSGPLE